MMEEKKGLFHWEGSVVLVMSGTDIHIRIRRDAACNTEPFHCFF